MKSIFQIMKRANNCFNYSRAIDAQIIDQKWIKSTNLHEFKDLTTLNESRLPPWTTIPFSIEQNEAKIRMSIKEFQDSAQSIKKSNRINVNNNKGRTTSELSPANIK